MRKVNKKKQPKAFMRILSLIISVAVIITDPYIFELANYLGVSVSHIVYAEEGGEAGLEDGGASDTDGEENFSLEDSEGADNDDGESFSLEADEEDSSNDDGEDFTLEDCEGSESEDGEGIDNEGSEDFDGEEDNDSDLEETNDSSEEAKDTDSNIEKGTESENEGSKGTGDKSIINITTVSELVQYSKDYSAANINDTINIAISSSDDPTKTIYQSTATIYQFAEYVSIGSSEATAFAGTMNITTNLYSYINFDKPMFGYIKDSAVINVTGGNNNGYLELRRTDTDSMSPMFAEHVIHDSNYDPANENSYNQWKIKLSYYDEEGEANARVDFSGVIGSIEDNCKIKLDILNDTKKAAQDQTEQDLIENIVATGNGQNAGLACGTLGQNAKLIVSVGGSNTDFSVTSASGHSGALVGEMKEGSNLSLSGNNITGGNGRTIKASGGYAGGLVGKITDASITYDSNFTVNEYIEGSLGAGGIAGYYKGSSTNSFGLSNASINCKLKSANAGGVFGVLETTGDFSFDETDHTNSITSSPNGQANSSYYGGLIGRYKTSALTNTLTIGNITINTSGSSGNCAGLIGVLDDGVSVYVVVNGATVSNAIESGFHGIINNAGNAGHFLDIRNFTLSGSDYSGAGLVGTIGAGVIRLSGTTDLSAKSKGAQLVYKRGNTLIYALGNGSDSGWTLKRCEPVACDDIGNWGEVLRISSTGEYTGVGDSDTTSGSDNHILTLDAAAHTVTVTAPNVSANTVTIATTNDFVRTALNMQINQGNCGALKFADSTNNSTKLLGSSSIISITGTINLSGTGIMGLMRDDGKQNEANSSTESDSAFAGTINGGGTVNLAIGEYYGKRGSNAISSNGSGNGALHGHNTCGLVAVTNGATISNLTLGGSIYTIGTLDGMGVGGFVGKSEGNLTLSGINDNITFDAWSNDGNAKYFGGLIGWAGGASTVSISGNNKSVVKTNNASSIYASNGVGFVDNRTITINFSNYVLGDTAASTTSASISNPANSTMDHASCGGLIGYIKSGDYKKTVNLNGVSISHYQLDLTAKKGIGGVLGYAWYNTDVNLTGSGLTVSNCDVDQSYTSKGNGATSLEAGGLAYVASGHWSVEKLKIQDTDFGLNGVTSFGALFNSGICNNINNATNVLFLEIKTTSGAGTNFDLSDDVTVTDNNSKVAVYDELVAHTAFPNKTVLQEGNAVVSIHTPNGTVVGGKYQNQITPPNDLYDNENTRYYYDLDIIRSAVSSNTYDSDMTDAEMNAYKLMMWNVKEYANSSIKSYFNSEHNASSPISGDYDLSKVSYYPLNRSSEIKIKDASFVFNNKEIEDSSVNGNTYRSTMASSSQHYLMHSGLFYNVTGNITIQGNLTLGGTIGRHETGSGALVAGNLGGLTTGTTKISNTAGKKITLDGLRVNAPDTYVPAGSEEAASAYKPVLINTIGSHVSLNLNGVETKANSYADGNDIKMAGSSLIGVVGTRDNDNLAASEAISLIFNDIRLDARTDANKNDGNLSALTSAYGTTQGVFTKATLLEEFIFNNNTECKGVYNYKSTEDWNSSNGNAIHHVTYGYEIDGSVEFAGLQNQYVDLKGKTNPVSYNNTQGSDNYSFNKFLPYVAIRDYDESNAQKRSRELMVNHTNVGIEFGCGTYDDPYIIDKNGQIEAIAKILELGSVSDGFTINVPGCTKNNNVFSYNGWCEDNNGNPTHIQLTYNGTSFVAQDANKTHSTEQLAKYLAGAYYKITKVTEVSHSEEEEGEEGEEAEETITYTYSSITIEGVAFNGLGGNADAYVFHGVIIGDEDTADYPLINTTGAPLIKTSYGSVVKDLKIKVKNNNITRSQSDLAQKFIISGGCSNYGAVIGQILGGDNIIDGVTLDFSEATIKLEGTYPKVIPVGGFVGVIASGALIFRGTNSAGLSAGDVKNNSANIAMNSPEWLYVNPIIGRVLNGYAVYEAASNANSNDYKYSESSVTMKNGTKNYSIANIDPDYSVFSVSKYSQIGSTSYYTTSVSVPNDQALFILSLLTQSSSLGNDKYSTPLKVVSSDSYKDYTVMRHAQYNQIGTGNTSDYNTYAQYDTIGLGNVTSNTGFKFVPYLVGNYTAPVDGLYYALSLTNDKTVCSITLAGDNKDWYLPDGFKGIGYIGYKKDTLSNQIINLRQFAGGGKTIHLNMSLKHYSVNADNYYSSSGKVGFGLFNSIRHNDQIQGGAISENDLAKDEYKIKNLNITGTIDYDVVDIKTYSAADVYKDEYIDVGGFAGYCGFAEPNDLRIESIDLSGLTVNGFKTAGGLFGYLKMKDSADYLAKISNITAKQSMLTVTSKDYVGGIVGRCEQIGLTIDALSLDKLNIITYFCDTTGINYNNGAGGIIGWAQNASSNKPITLNNISVGSKTATTNLRIGYPDIEPYNKTNYADNYYQIATGGLIGRSMTAKNSGQTYSLIIRDCNIYNVDLYGHRVGGIIGHDSNGSTGKVASTTVLLMERVSVISTNNASINGIKKSTDLKDRGCGGFIGVMWNQQNKDFVDCRIEGYTLRSFNDTGGLCSNMQDKGTVTIKNFEASDLNIYSNYHGAMFGYLKAAVNGYNLLFDNIHFGNYASGNSYIDNKFGYLIGNNGGGKIQLVGVTRNHLEAAPSDHHNKIAGKSGNYNYGGGYIIWADALGYCTDTNSAGSVYSDLTSATNVTAKSPWVTVSPYILISGEDATVQQILTGESILSSYAAADALSNYNGADTTGILSALTDVPSAAKTNYATYRNAELFSTYKTEMGEDSLPEGVADFAVIAVDNNGANVSGAINSYVQMLTHTTYLYATQNNNNIYEIKIYRCTYNNATQRFVMTSGSTGLTRTTSNGFVPHIEYPDTDAETACFTLVDILFKDPADKNKVCYHLYVPVLIKKMVKFKFKASSMPGTIYDQNNYVYKSSSSTTEDKWGAPSVTNLGTPVTVFFRYEYTSTVKEWQDMIDAGESLMWHSNNKLLLKTAAENLPSGARMVLVDVNGNGSAYYAKTTDTGVFTRNTNSSQNDYYLDLTKFKNNSSEYFASENFGERLPITASTTSHTNAKAYVISGANESVYVKARINGEGNKIGFRPADSGDDALTKYYLTVDGATDGAPAGLSENYYLTIYTDASDDALRVISVNSAASLSSAPQTGEGLSRHNLRCVTQAESALILGNIYKQNFTKFETTNGQNGLVNNSRNYIESDIVVEIAVNNDNNEADTIITYLANPSIKVYHNILLMLTKNDGSTVEKTIYGTPTYSVNTTKAEAGVYGSISSKLGNQSTVDNTGFSINTPQKISNFIQICDSDYDIKPFLVETIETVDANTNSSTTQYGGAIVSISGLRTHFDYQNIPNQFPYRPSGNTTIGTSVTAYSTLDSDAMNVAYSNVRVEKTDTNAVKYYGEQPEMATLVYAVDSSSDVELIQNLNLLGINPKDDPDYKTNTIIADGTYNAVSFVDSTQAKKIRWTLSLEKKNENGIYEPVDMSLYVSGNVVVGNRAEGAMFTKSGNGYYYDEDFTTPMDITTLTTIYVIKTGADLEAIGGDNPVAGVYANYKVTLSATLYKETGALEGDISGRVISGSTKEDYIKYTNAKVVPSWVKSH